MIYQCQLYVDIVCVIDCLLIVRIIKKVALWEMAKAHAPLLPTIRLWLATVTAARWRNLAEVRQTFNSADRVRLPSGRVVYVFNLHSYRLICAIHFTPSLPRAGRVYIRELLTHAEYDRQDWKKRH